MGRGGQSSYVAFSMLGSFSSSTLVNQDFHVMFTVFCILRGRGKAKEGQSKSQESPDTIVEACKVPPTPGVRMQG